MLDLTSSSSDDAASLNDVYSQELGSVLQLNALASRYQKLQMENEQLKNMNSRYGSSSSSGGSDCATCRKLLMQNAALLNSTTHS